MKIKANKCERYNSYKGTIHTGNFNSKGCNVLIVTTPIKEQYTLFKKLFCRQLYNVTTPIKEQYTPRKIWRFEFFCCFSIQNYAFSYNMMVLT